MRRISGDLLLEDVDLLKSAVHTAEGLRSQFNAPKAVALLQVGRMDKAYWQCVLEYGLDGNLQALPDEYAHTLSESAKARGLDSRGVVGSVAAAMFGAMSIRTVLLQPDEYRLDDGQVAMEKFSIRCHYALRSVS